MWVDRLRYVGTGAIGLHDLLNAARRERTTARRFEQVPVFRMGFQMTSQDQSKAGWEQNVAVLGSLALLDEDPALLQIHIVESDAYQFLNAHGRVKQQL